MKEEEKNHRTTPQPLGRYMGRPDIEEMASIIANDLNDDDANDRHIPINLVSQIGFKFLQLFEDALIEHGDVLLQGFGSIRVDTIKAHRHYNPDKDEYFNVPETFKFDFTPHMKLRQNFKKARGVEVVHDTPPTN